MLCLICSGEEHEVVGFPCASGYREQSSPGQSALPICHLPLRECPHLRTLSRKGNSEIHINTVLLIFYSSTQIQHFSSDAFCLILCCVKFSNIRSEKFSFQSFCLLWKKHIYVSNLGNTIGYGLFFVLGKQFAILMEVVFILKYTFAILMEVAFILKCTLCCVFVRFKMTVKCVEVNVTTFQIDERPSIVLLVAGLRKEIQTLIAEVGCAVVF